MKTPIGVAALVAVAATILYAQDMGRPKPPGEEIIVEETYRSAPGDSLKYTLRWGAGTRANGYGIKVNVQQTNCASWTGLPPAAGATVGGSQLSYAFTAICTTWDTVTFNAIVWSIGGGGLPSKDSSKAQWKTSRRPGMPGPIIVDSLVITALDIKPDQFSIVPGAKQSMCAIIGFKTGQWALRSKDKQPNEPTGFCDSVYSAFSTNYDFENMYPSPAQQARADSVCINWTATGGSITQELCPGPIEVFNGRRLKLLDARVAEADLK